MIEMQITVDVNDDRRVVLTLPPEVPTGKTDLLVTVSPHAGAADEESAIQIVDRGRGPQLSTSRITVQDVVPYLRDGCANDEIIRAMPTLGEAELEVIRRYVRDNFDAVMAQDRRIGEVNAARVTPPEVQEIRAAGRAKRVAAEERLAPGERTGE